MAVTKPPTTQEPDLILSSSTAKTLLVGLICIFSNRPIHGIRSNPLLATRYTHLVQDLFMHQSLLRTTSTFLVGTMVRTDVMTFTALISRQTLGVSCHRMGIHSRHLREIVILLSYIIDASTYLVDTMATTELTISIGIAFKMALGI